MKSKLDTFKWLWKKHGLSGFVTYFARKLLWPHHGGKATRMFLFVLDTPRPTPAAIKAAENHTFRFASLEELQELHKDPVWDIKEKDLQAFAQGDRCLLQLDGDKLAGYAWLASSQLVEIMWGFHFNMPDDVVYNYKGYTNPDYRGMGFQPLRHLKLLEQVKQEGKGRLFGYVDHLNMNSLRGVRKSGYKKIGALRCVFKNGQASFKLQVSESGWSRARRT